MKIDLKKLLEEISDERIIEIVTELGSDYYEDKGNYIVFKTICHNENAEDASMKLYYYKQNKKFHCYTDCNENFNLFTLFKKRYELLGVEYNFYKDIVLKIVKGQKIKFISQDFNNPYKTIYHSTKKPNVKLEKYPERILNLFITDYAPVEWLDDGINEETMRLYNIRYSIESNKIIIPHYDINNNLIGIRGRNLNKEDIEIGKYMPVQIQDKIYSHPLMFNLYGLNIVKENIKKYKMAIVAESEVRSYLSFPLPAGSLCGYRSTKSRD